MALTKIQAELTAFTPAGTGATVRTVDSKLEDVVSVKDFGAKGDGTTDDTVAIQAALDASTGSQIICTGTHKITSSLTLKSNTRLVLPANTSIVWHGSSGGTVITTPSTTVAIRCAIECDGGIIDMRDAGFGFKTNSVQYGYFDLHFISSTTTIGTVSSPSNSTAIAVDINANSSSTAGSDIGTKNTVSNQFERILHEGQCGTLLRMGNDTASDRVVTLNHFGQVRGGYQCVNGIEIKNYVDTNSFYGSTNLRLNKNNAIGIKMDGLFSSTSSYGTVYQIYFDQVSIGMYGTHTGRIGLKIFNGCKHITLNNFFCDGVPAGNSEFGAFTAFDTGNAGTNADAKTYRFNFQHAGTGGDFIEQHQRGYTQRADSFTSRESEVTLSDNTVHSFKLGPQNETRGLIAIAATGGNTSGLVWVNVSSSGAASKLLASDGTGVFVVATGALTGTTGTDTKFTISAHTDGKVYIENRVGFATKFSYTILSAF